MKTERLTCGHAEAFARDVLLKLGHSARDAELVARHLVAAEARGYPSHGFRRLIGIAGLTGKVNSGADLVTQVSKPGFVLFDGAGRLGIAVVHDALEVLTGNLDGEGAVVFGLTGYVGTTGSIGIYAHALAGKGIASILMCSSEYAVAPHGSARAVLGTNPIAVGFPGQPVEFCGDVSTAAWSYGAIKDAALARKRLPTGVVQTATGHSSTDPNDADNGSMLPMAGHKGYALGLAVELLCGPLIGGKAGRNAVPGSDGFFGVLVRADCARPAETVNLDAQALFAEIRSGPPINEKARIRIPGDASARRQAEAHYIEVPKNLLDQLRKLGG